MSPLLLVISMFGELVHVIFNRAVFVLQPDITGYAIQNNIFKQVHSHNSRHGVSFKIAIKIQIAIRLLKSISCATY